MRGRVIAIVATLVLFLASSPVWAGGLSTRFVEVKLENLQPGKTYSVKAEKGRELKVSNTTENITTDIKIAPERPVGHDLVPGYEPIPDLTWVKVEKNYFEKVGPGQSISTDIKITIPAGDLFRGKKYQVYVYSHTAGAGTFRIGIMSRILFTTARS